MFLKRHEGFTILELLIVIAVISILVGIALPRFKGMQDEGNIAKAKGELRTLQTAVESYNIHNGSYPANIGAALTGATPAIITTAPTDPFSSAAYGYVLNAPYYIIYSVGPSGTGSATVTAAGVVTETNGSSCIYVTNGATADTTP